LAAAQFGRWAALQVRPFRRVSAAVSHRRRPQGQVYLGSGRDRGIEAGCTNSGSDRSQLTKVASQAKEVLGADELDVVADRGYFNSTEILACAQADITVTLPKPMTSGAKSEGRLRVRPDDRAR
jgi:hypothetical protein